MNSKPSVLTTGSRRRLSQQFARLRWKLPLLVSLFVLAQQAHEHFLAPPGIVYHLLPEIAIYALAGPAVIWVAMGWIFHKVELKEAAEDNLVQAHTELTQLHQRVSFLLRINRRLGEAAEEGELAALAMQLVQEVVPLAASALIRFDEHSQPLPVEYQGDLDEAALAAWREYLSSQRVRERCAACLVRTALRGEACPLFENLPVDKVGGVVCLPLNREEKEFGILSLYLPAARRLQPDEVDLLQAIAAEISSAFDNIRLRSRELATLYEINEAIHQRLDLNGLMDRILAHTAEASDADAGMLLLEEDSGGLSPYAATGRWAEERRWPLVESLAAGARDMGETLVVGDLDASAETAAAVLCAPMMTDEGCRGVIVLGSLRAGGFSARQKRLVSAIAGQTALLVENTRLYARLEHQAILAERDRLAREMHDGLAQTLGYLKMRSQQMGRWLAHGQVAEVESGLAGLARTVDEMYAELRSAIDGLRLPLGSRAGFLDRVRACVDSFGAHAAASVELIAGEVPEPTPSAQAHMLRLIQEALTNIRKHAQARHVWIYVDSPAGSGDLRIQIRDDGCGFDPTAAAHSNRHGLKIMNERAQLLGADLHVDSQPGQGACVVLEWNVLACTTKPT